MAQTIKSSNDKLLQFQIRGLSTYYFSVLNFFHGNMFWVLIRSALVRGAFNEYPYYVFIKKQEKYHYFWIDKKAPYLEL